MEIVGPEAVAPIIFFGGIIAVAISVFLIILFLLKKV
jgi:hypothetical protein